MEKFEEWAVIDLFGHQKIAGRVSEQQLGGASFIRVDVPRTKAVAPFTKLYGPGAIYSITITDEETAMAAAVYYAPEPMDKWTVADMVRNAKGLPVSAESDNDDEDEASF